MALEGKIEIVDLPDENEFKIVQLVLDGLPIMLCGYSYHSEILENYLRLCEIIPDRLTLKGIFKNVEVPVVKGKRYEVVGMGRAKISHSRKFFQLPYGESADYKIGPNYEFREQLRKQFEGWKFEE